MVEYILLKNRFNIVILTLILTKSLLKKVYDIIVNNLSLLILIFKKLILFDQFLT